MALADTLGARAETLAGGDMVDAMVRYVRRHNITKAVVGRTRASGLLRLRLSASALLNAALSPGWLWRRHSFADMLAAGCPEIDVIRLGAPPLPASAAPGRDPLTLGQRARQAAEERGSRPWPAMPGRCATAPSPRRCRRWPSGAAPDQYRHVVPAGGGGGGRQARPRAGGAGLGGQRGPVRFFFVQPLASFAVSDVQYLLTFGVLLAVGLLIGQLTAGLRLQAQVSVKREADARSLYEFARELSSALLPEQILASAGLFVHATFGSRCALYILGLDDRLCWPRPPPTTCRRWNQRWRSGCTTMQPAGAGTATLSNSELLYLPLKAPCAPAASWRWPRRAAACSPIPNRGVRSKPTPR